MTLTPFAELSRATADVRSWHQPVQHARNKARRNCRECGFPWPCRTYERLTDSGRPAGETPNQEGPHL